MRRADRLFQLVQILRNKRLITAHDLAERLDVSQRTIYRDIQDLSLSGIPIEGEAGVGYHLRYSLDVPPLMFNADELEALVLGVRILKVWGGPELGSSAQSVLDKIQAVIPTELHSHIDDSKLFALKFSDRHDIKTTLDHCRNAISNFNYLLIDYKRADKTASQRKLKPLGLFFWGNVWTLTAWCELRNDFRNFRLDRIQTLHILEQTFNDQNGQTLDDYIAQMRNQCEKQE
jgi:predicted DNA-binding transcriptional regulator YafY